jgi:hypothetical protein
MILMLKEDFLFRDGLCEGRAESSPSPSCSSNRTMLSPRQRRSEEFDDTFERDSLLCLTFAFHGSRLSPRGLRQNTTEREKNEGEEEVEVHCLGKTTTPKILNSSGYA